MVNFVFLSVYFYSVPNLRFSNPYKLRKVRLGDICTITGGYAFDSHKMKQQGEYQIIKMGNLYNGIFDLSRNQSFINAPTKKELEYLIQKNDILITLTGTTNKKDYGYTVQIEKPKKLLLNQRCALIRASKVNEKYLFYLLNSNDFLKQFYASSTGGTGNQTNVSINDMLDFKVYISNENDQLKISNILNALDKKISTQIKIIDTLSSQKKQIRNLIFKDIHKNANCCIQDYVIYEQPQKYIVHSTDYVSHGKDYTPVLTANQSFILGYTLEKDGIYKKGDCIIFDDFTNENKYVDFPFKVKSSAMKILTANEKLINTKYAFYAMQCIECDCYNHKRYWISDFSNKLIPLPPLEEQLNIVHTIEKLYNYIEKSLN